MDASKYARSGAADESNADWGFVPSCMMSDEDRFKDCLKLMCKCFSCESTSPFPGVVDGHGRCGLYCPSCGAAGWGLGSEANCYGYISNQLTLLMRECLRKYYDTVLICDDPTCGRKTRQQSVMKNMCSACRGVVLPEYSEAQLHCQIKYLESLFDASRALPDIANDKER